MSRNSCVAIAASSAMFLIAWPASADIVVDDFEDVSDWSGVTLETAEIHGGSGAGRWDDHINRTSIRKSFSPALDTTGEVNFQFWAYAGVANDAQIELILYSENDSDPAGSDYYRYQLHIDWTGWRYFRIPKSTFQVARNPIGWHQLDSVSLSAAGWGHDPLADTLLILDDMSFGVGVIERIDVTSGFQGGDFVYDFTLALEERTGASRSLGFAVDPHPGNPFGIELLDPNVSLVANGTGTARVRVTVAASAISDATRLDLHKASVFVTEQSATVDGAELDAAVPLPARAHPRTLLDASDFERISTLSGSEAWAASARDSIVASADGWPSSYEQEYGLSSWALPPEGGQWTLWYVCPTHGVQLTYEGPTTHVCPVDGEVHSGWPFDQVVYSWMHGDLASYANDLGLAYRLTGDSGYGQAALAILLAYADAYSSYPIHDVNGGAGGSGGKVLSQTLDESVWLIPIAWAYDLIADASFVTDSQREHIERDLLRAAVATIQRHPAGKSNWQSWHNAGIGAVAFALEDPALIATVLRGSEGFEFQMQESVSADGFWYEGSWGYHFYALSALMQLSEMANRAGYDAYGNPALRSMFEAPLLFSMPDWTLPAFNDSGTSNLVSNDRFFEAAYHRYQDDMFTVVLGQRPRRRDALFFGSETLPPEGDLSLRSHLFPDAGYAVLRAGEGDDATYLALDFGPHGGGHGHYDKLGFVLFARGTVMGVDPGTQSYAAPTHATWDKSTIAHNTVVVDETTQAEATGHLHRFEALADVTLASADAGEANESATLLRSMLMTPEYVIDRFHASSVDGSEHDFDWIHHNTGTLATSLPLASYGDLPDANGYQHLSDAASAAGDETWSVTFAHALEAMEYGSTWASEAGIAATFAHSQEQAHAGAWSGKLAYDFTQATGYVLYTTERPDDRTEVPTGVTLAVYGDGSGHELSLRVYDNTDERFVHTVGPVDWTGWQIVEVADIQGWNHYLGNEDGVFDTPARSVAIQISHEAGGPSSGALYVDDIVLGFASGDVLVEDFEIPARSIDVRMLGAPGTVVVAGEGLGPNLMEPLPFVMARRRATDTVFESVFAPYGMEPRVTQFESIPTNAPTADQVGAYRISGEGFEDHVLFSSDGEGSVSRSFGEQDCDGVLCLVRRDASGALTRLALVDGTTLNEESTGRVMSEGVLDGLQVDYRDAGTSLDVFARVSIDAVVRIWGPEVVDVRVNDQPAEFTKEPDYVVLNLDPSINPDGGTGGAGGSGGADGGTGANAGGQDATGGGDEGGCGCRASRGGLGWLTVLLPLLWACRRRRLSDSG